jgi:hypothetical protein
MSRKPSGIVYIKLLSMIASGVGKVGLKGVKEELKPFLAHTSVFKNVFNNRSH